MRCSRPGPDLKLTGYRPACRYEAEWIVTLYVRDIKNRVGGIDQPVCSVHLISIMTEMMDDGLKRFQGFVVRRSDTPALEGGQKRIEA